MSRGVINIIGEIGKDVFLENIKSQVNSQPKADSFDVNINSIGGDLFEGWDIYEYLLTLDVDTKGLGVVASISSLIFLAGKERSISTGTDFLCHYPRISNVNDITSKGLKDLSAVMAEFDNWLVQEYVNKTNLSFEEISKIMDKDELINNEDLFKWGFTTKEALKLTAKATINNNDMNNEKSSKWKKLVQMVDEALSGGSVKVENKMLYSADQKEVFFPDLEEEATIEVGDVVRIDGETITEEVEVVLADGRTFVIEDGKVKEIREEEEKVMVEAKIKKLASQVEEMKITNKRLEEERDDFSKKLEAARASLKEIQEYGSKIVAKDKRDNESRFTENSKGGAFDNAFKALNN